MLEAMAALAGLGHRPMTLNLPGESEQVKKAVAGVNETLPILHAGEEDPAYAQQPQGIGTENMVQEPPLQVAMLLKQHS